MILAANRDEMIDRPWRPPGRHWPDRADVVAGRDELAFGTWLGINDTGVVAAIMNREGSLGPDPDKRSRGELVLEALDHAEAAAAAAALGDLDGRAWRPFNLVVADCREAFFVRHHGGAKPEVRALAEGLSMITSHDPNDRASARIEHYLDRFIAAAPPDPDADDWAAWQTLLADTAPPSCQPASKRRSRSSSDTCKALLVATGSGTPMRDHRAASRYVGVSASTAAFIFDGIGPLPAGTEKFGVRWKTVSAFASLAMSGMAWMPEEPVPMTATRWPVKSTPS